MLPLHLRVISIRLHLNIPGKLRMITHFRDTKRYQIATSIRAILLVKLYMGNPLQSIRESHKQMA